MHTSGCGLQSDFAPDPLGRDPGEESFRRREVLLEQVLQLAGTWEMDVQAGEVVWSKKVYRILELSPDAPAAEATIPVEKAISFYAPEARPKIREACRRCVEEGRPYDLELPLVTAKGNRRWVRTVGAPAEEKEGEVHKVVGAVKDITERKNREQSLRQYRRRLEAVFEDPKMLVGVLGPDGTLLRANQTAKAYINVGREDLVGTPFWKTPWWDEETRPKVRQWIRQAAAGEYVEFEAEHPGPEGGLRSVRGTIRPVTGGSGEVVSLIVSARDVTERKRREKKIIEAKREAEKANRLKSAFLANMSHEIRTPLTSVIGFADTIGEEVKSPESGDGNDELVSRFAGLIKKTGRRLLEALESILNLSRLEAGEMEFSPEPVDLTEEVEEVATLFGLQVKEAGIDLQIEVPDGPLWGEADEGGVRLVLRNLVSNAIKYTDAGGRVWIRAQDEGDVLALEVEDTGIGMDPQEVPELFEPFNQGGKDGGRKHEGTGLGLAVTKRVVDQMEGTIDVETEKGKGSRFTVRLPGASQQSEKGARPEDA